MKVIFKGKILDIKNESKTKKNLILSWNGYTIGITQCEDDKKTYDAYCINPLGSWICDTITCNKISECVQECFDNIAIDIDDLKSNYDEIGQWLDLVKEYLK